MKYALVLLFLSVALAACQNQAAVAPDARPPGPPPPPAEAGTVQPRISGPVANRASSSRPLVSYGAEHEVRSGRVGTTRSGSTSGDYTLNFVDADIREIAAAILGDMLQINYAIDPSVRGTATVKTPRPLPRDELLPALRTLLNQNGLTLLVQDGLYRVAPAAAATASPTLGGDTEIIALRYASAKELADVLQPFLTEGGKVSADPAHNALILSGDTNARSALRDLIRSFDIDLLANQSYAIFPVVNGSPDQAANELRQALGGDEETPAERLVRVIPMQRANAILVVSNQPRYVENARRLFRMTEQARGATARTWHVYYVQNGQSSDLEYVLQRAFTPGHVTSTRGGLAPAGTTAPGFDQMTMNSRTRTGTGTGIGRGGNEPIADGSAEPSAGTIDGQGGLGDGFGAAPEAGPPEALSELGGGEDAEADGIRIIANRTNNALLIYATPDEYSTIEAMLRKIDILPLQVRIDATIAEVTLNDTLRYGTQFFFKSGGLQGFLSNTDLGTAAGEFPGFVLTRGVGSVRFAISALQNVTNVRVLSSPQVMVLDNQPARLQVGDLVPYLTQSAISTDTSDAPIVNNIDYRETGVILQVVPRVNSGGLVSLDIAQEVSDVRETTSSTINSPTFLERKVRSRVVIQDGDTIGLAGLIRDNDSVGNSGLPWLKNIPVLGAVFGTQNNVRVRTELLVLITPHVVHDQRDARALTADLRENLSGASAVPAALPAKPTSGANDPHGKYIH